MLVGLTGYAGAGKDTAAEGLIARGWTRIAFADPLKDLARRLGWDGQKDVEGRAFLQLLGQVVREELDPDAWVRAAERRIAVVDGPVVVTDVRYPNEARMIESRGGRIIRIVRPNVGPVNGHASETAMDDWPAQSVCNNATPSIVARRLVDVAGRCADE